MKTQIEKIDRLIREIEMDEYLNEETLPKIREVKGLLDTINNQNLKDKALHWWMILSDNGLWDKMEQKHGYYGHDIGTTEEDILNMYKAEYNCS